jgi:hypothetical protein
VLPEILRFHLECLDFEEDDSVSRISVLANSNADDANVGTGDRDGDMVTVAASVQRWSSRLSMIHCYR